MTGDLLLHVDELYPWTVKDAWSKTVAVFFSTKDASDYAEWRNAKVTEAEVVAEETRDA